MQCCPYWSCAVQLRTSCGDVRMHGDRFPSTLLFAIIGLCERHVDSRGEHSSQYWRMHRQVADGALPGFLTPDLTYLTVWLIAWPGPWIRLRCAAYGLNLLHSACVAPYSPYGVAMLTIIFRLIKFSLSEQKWFGLTRFTLT